MKWHSSFSLQKTAYNISGCAFLSGKQNVFHQKFLEMIHINHYFKSSYTSLIEIIENQGMSVIHIQLPCTITKEIISQIKVSLPKQ